jgi:hypothetical protein
MAGWASPEAKNEPTPGTPEHNQWAHNQIMNQAMQLAGSGVIAGEGALGAGMVPHEQWYRGADEMKRFEIPDFQSKFDMPGVQQYIDERNKVAPDMHVIGEVGEVLDHPELYKHYPEIKNLPVFIAPTAGEHAMDPHNSGQYIRPTEDLPQGGIMLNPHEVVRDAKGETVVDANGKPVQRPATGDELHTVLMHELNHYIQDKEGFAGGASVEGVGAQLKYAQSKIDTKIAQLRATSPGHPDIAKLINESDNIDQLLKYDPYHLYSTTAGEVESFNVEDRMNAGKEALQAGVPPDEIARRLGQPTKTQAVPNKQQLVFPAPPRINLQPVDHTPETAPIDNPTMTRGFHGTGAPDFDSFSNEFIGTGEGAQAYGWGHYMAGAEQTAKGYWKKLSQPQVLLDGKPIDFSHVENAANDAESLGLQKILEAGGGVKEAKDYLQGRMQHYTELLNHHNETLPSHPEIPALQRRLDNNSKALDWINANESRLSTGRTGALLEVAMKPDEHELLDYDKQFSEQTPEIQAKLKALGVGEPKDLKYTVEANSPPGWKNFKAQNPYSEHGPSVFFSQNLKTGETTVMGHLGLGRTETYSSPEEAMKAAENGLGTNMTGAEIYRKLAVSESPKDTSMRLHQAGIPGLKFLDQGSRQLNPLHSGVEFNGINMTGPGDLPSYRFGNSQKAGLNINDDSAHEGLSLVHKYGNVDKTLVALDTSHAEMLAKEPPPGNPDLYKRLARENRDAAAWLQNNKDKITLSPPKKPTHNYVIFDPSNIKITAKNGKRLIPVDHDPFAEPESK